ncbi:hypothetical protein Scep_001739 [Stephania cephalantha]|uniref:Uncharacterized protein n=1 Tax=Stephania cephalantha TaxID=152367 RepID=A0AAP0L9X3_9MAGN
MDYLDIHGHAKFSERIVSNVFIGFYVYMINSRSSSFSSLALWPEENLSSKAQASPLLKFCRLKFLIQNSFDLVALLLVHLIHLHIPSLR